MQSTEYQCKKWQEVSDSMLVEQVISDPHASFETLIDRYHSSLSYLISHYLSDNDEANDILQQVFIQLFVSLPTIRVKESIKPWLMRVTLNKCLDELRTLRKRKCILLSELEWERENEDVSPLAFIPAPGPSLEEIAEHHEMQRKLESVIHMLPSKLRSVAQLRYLDQYTYHEIGQRLHISEMLARTYCYRAKNKLRIALAEVFNIKQTASSDTAFCRVDASK